MLRADELSEIGELLTAIESLCTGREWTEREKELDRKYAPVGIVRSLLAHIAEQDERIAELDREAMTYSAEATMANLRVDKLERALTSMEEWLATGPCACGPDDTCRKCLMVEVLRDALKGAM